MTANAIGPLAKVARHRFQSFSEAAGTVLDLLSPLFPESTVVLGQLDDDEGAYRIVDSRGERDPALDAGSILPVRLTGLPNASGNGRARMSERQSLSLVVAGSVVSVPLETSDGREVGALCALSSGADAYEALHEDVLTVAGRLLAYEWERVMWAADMLRLGDQLRDPARSDPVTGLLNRESFQEAAERERRLSLGGPVESYLAVISVTGLDAVRSRYGEPMADLLLKEAAEILAGAIRHADHAGHVGGDLLAAVLVDCSGTEGAAAFCDRLGTTFSRVMRDRPESVGVSFAALSLGDFPSSEAALEAAAPDAGARRAPGRGET